MAYEHVTGANDARLAPYACVRDADLAAWPASPAGLFMAESRAVIAAASAPVMSLPPRVRVTTRPSGMAP